jgi:light-regulated signal transduction histidine kinase (bacteriophytochrome)
LSGEAKDYLQRIRSGVQKMGHLIDNMLELSKLTRKQMNIQTVDLTQIAWNIINGLKAENPKRSVEFVVADRLSAEADPDLMEVLLVNLIGNAWKYSSKVECPRIEIGTELQDDRPHFFVSDNGAGFDMSYYNKLFGAFQRLHRDSEFPGTGVGLAIVQRVVHRHGGRVWAKSEVNKGATFYFFLAPEPSVSLNV